MLEIVYHGSERQLLSMRTSDFRLTPRRPCFVPNPYLRFLIRHRNSTLLLSKWFPCYRIITV